MATTTTTCYRHPDRETGVSCSSCGRPICPDCMTPTPVGMRCPECAKQKTQVRRVSSGGYAGDGNTVTVTLIIINVIAFLASGQFGVEAQSTRIFNDGALSGPYVAINHEYWRLVTGGFLHAGLLHIGFNMYILWFLGNLLEPALGSRRFLGLYVVSLLAGSCGALISSPVSQTVGASGAVFGLMGVAFFEMRARGIDPMANGIGPMILINLAISFVIPTISIGGHIGGLVGGSLAALAMQEADRRRQPVLGWVALGVIGVAAVAGAIYAANAGLPAGLEGIGRLPRL